MNHDPPAAPALDAADTLSDAARAFLPDATEIASVAGHPDLARVSAPSGIWGVRRWPESTPLADIAFSHRVMHLAREAGVDQVPSILPLPDAPEDAALRLGNQLFDAWRWLPGEPPARAEAAWPEPDDRIELPVVLSNGAFTEVVTALAQFHESTAPLASSSATPAAPLHLLPGAVRQAQGRHMDTLRARTRHEPMIQRWLATSERLLAGAEPVVHSATQEATLSQAILHLGLWPAHVLFDNGQLSGLLGWERVASGSPLLDIAQAILRLQGWHDDAVELALGTYGDIRELAPQERRLLPAVAALDAVATTGRLLEQTYTAPTTARPPTVLRNALEMMLRSMTAIDRNLNAPARKGRVWNRNRPSPGRARKGAPRERQR